MLVVRLWPGGCSVRCVRQQDDKRNTYAVEASGWDAKGVFFMEVSDLIWEESGRRTLRLNHYPKGGSLIFIRLLGELPWRGSVPTPYQVAQAAESRPDGLLTFELISTQPSRSKAKSLRGHVLHLMKQGLQEVKR